MTVIGRARIIDKDKGFKALMNRLRRANRAITVGIHSDAGGASYPDSKANILDIGTFHEFGLGNNPERSFIREWVDEEEDKNNALLRAAAITIFKGRNTVDQALEKTGLVMVGNIQKRLRGGLEPPLQPETIERKGSSTPLLDKGQLITGIAHKVE